MNCLVVEQQLAMIRHAIYAKNWKLLAQLSEVPMSGDDKFPGNTVKSRYEIIEVYTRRMIKGMTALATVDRAGKAEIFMEKSEESLTGWKIYGFYSNPIIF